MALEQPLRFRRPPQRSIVVAGVLIAMVIVSSIAVALAVTPLAALPGGILALAVTIVVIERTLRTAEVSPAGISAGGVMTRWPDLIAYSFEDPDSVTFIRRGSVLNTPEDLSGFYCPRDSWPAVEEAIRRYAPKATN